MSNSQGMSIEERIVQTLKEDRLMTIIGGDEDMIRQLVERALKEALFEDRKRPGLSHYDRPSVEPSAVVQAAREAAAKVAKEAAENLIDQIMARPEIRSKIIEVMPVLLVKAIMDRASGIWDESRNMIVMDAEAKIRSAMGGLS